MKYTSYIIMTAAAIMMASCGGSGSSSNSSTGKKFAPKEKTSTMSDEAREERIAEKRHSLFGVDTDSLILAHGVKFSVLPPATNQNLSEAASDKLGSKMIQIAASNGIGGLCTNPVLAMVAKVDCVDRSMTATAPQKAIVKYEITFYCGNTITNDIYGSCAQTVTGVGANLDDAGSKAMNEVKNTKGIQAMLQTASNRAIQWYNATNNIKKFVDTAVADKNYALAMSLLSSVPEQATATYAYATKRNAEISEMLFQEKAAELLGGLEDAIAEAGDDYNPEIGAYLKVIPPSSNSYARAKNIYDAYVKRTRDVADDKRKKEHELAIEQLAVEKIKAPYVAKAALEEMKENASVQKHELWSGALSSAAESIGNGIRGGMFGENGMFGKGGLFGLGSFADIFGGSDDD